MREVLIVIFQSEYASGSQIRLSVRVLYRLRVRKAHMLLFSSFSVILLALTHRRGFTKTYTTDTYLSGL